MCRRYNNEKWTLVLATSPLLGCERRRTLLSRVWCNLATLVWAGAAGPCVRVCERGVCYCSQVHIHAASLKHGHSLTHSTYISTYLLAVSTFLPIHPLALGLRTAFIHIIVII